MQSCDHRHKLLQLAPGLFDRVACFAGCLVNEIVALRERHLMAVPVSKEIETATKAVGKFICKRLPRLRIKCASEEFVLRNKPSHTRKRTIAAFAKLRRDGFNHNMARVNAFIKFEKYADTLDDPLVDKAPRMIQYRSYPYCALISRFLLPLELKIWEWDDKCSPAPVSERVFSKHMNSFHIAERLRSMDRYGDTMFILLDHSRFDAHIRRDMLMNVEFRIYKQVIRDQLFFQLIDMQLDNVCYTRNGIKYKCPGRKMSGEYNTSLGDSLINWAMLEYWLRDIPHQVLVNGDDSVVAIPSSRFLNLDKGFFQSVGLVTKIETTHLFEHVEFCQCRPVEVCPGLWRMVRNPRRVLSRAGITIRSLQGKARDDWLHCVGMGEVACNSGVPVLQSLGVALMKRGRFRRAFYDEIMARRLDEYRGVSPISECARASFSIAWGIPICEQLLLERAIGAFIGTIGSIRGI